MATNKGARSASAILHKDKDRYLLDQCSSERFVVVELCQEIEVQTILLSNFEFFSSTFRHFNVYTSSRYPPKEPDGWYLAGSFEALDTRNTQAFDVHLPQVWIKYLKIEFLSHYGDEYYCPISQIKVFGPTMLVEYLDSQERQNKADENSPQVMPPNSFTVSDDQSLLEKLVPKPVAHETPKLDLPKPLQSPIIPKAYPISLPKPSPQCFPPKPSFLLPVCKISPKTPYRRQDLLEELFLPKCSIGTQPKLPSPSASARICEGQATCTETLTQEELPLLTSQASATPGPGTGSENVFRTMARRLDNLENKYALLESYINEQTIALNSILTKMNAQQEQQLLSAFNDISLRSKQQMEHLKRSHEEVWSGLFHRIESSNAKLHLEVASLNQKVNLLAEEVIKNLIYLLTKYKVMFGKRMALAQLTILFIVVVMVVLVQLYYSAFNSKAYLQQSDFGISMPSSPGFNLHPASTQPGRINNTPSGSASPAVAPNPGPVSDPMSPIAALNPDPASVPVSSITISNQGCNATSRDMSYQQAYESLDPQVSSPPRPISSKSMDDMLLKHTPILQVSSEYDQEYTPPYSRNLPLTPPDTSHIDQPSSSFPKDYSDG
ncbi:hypothetical protein DSO57_1017645 [Entomophthora muscae]|uniref:Uncharacterized protein n=1 Tax=Entomophthora muscae TaxID=34485 RepID=A0ACC2TS31_9FUNG|nr:hypothetical protein DSO57_1017645 [Entomophthora muscae]